MMMMKHGLILLLVVVGWCRGQNPAGEAVDAKSGLAQSIKTEFLKMHNYYRRKEGAADMEELVSERSFFRYTNFLGDVLSLQIRTLLASQRLFLSFHVDVSFSQWNFYFTSEV